MYVLPEVIVEYLHEDCYKLIKINKVYTKNTEANVLRGKVYKSTGLFEPLAKHEVNKFL